MTLLTSSLLAISLATCAYTSPLSTSPYNAPSQRSPFVKAPLFEDQLHGFVNDSYIVKFRDDFDPALYNNHFNLLQTKHAENPLVGDDAGLRHVYQSGGYSGRFHDNVIDQIRAMPEVAFVERDQVVRISDEVVADHDIVSQKSAPWGLARVSHRNRLGFGTFTRYDYVASGGEGVDVYIIDTGVYVDHPDFEGRAHWGKTIPKDDTDEDANGHGTHCAGTIGSKSYGVAKKAQLYGVKVLGSNGSGTMSDVVAGVEWAAKAANDKRKSASSKHKGSVANMSLGGGKSPTLDQMVNKATELGLHFAVAAGNENRDACNSSPAAAEKAITVGASTITDERAYFSNHGPCVDIFGPGLNIKSVWNNGGTNTISGTSMASPHVAGLMAYFLSLYPSVTFNPERNMDDVLIAQQHTFSSIYRIVRDALPTFIHSMLPPPAIIEATVAPVPSKPLSSDELKDAILAIASATRLLARFLRALQTC
ncbi:peptidase S8/S53 domain-containing protein [Rhodocollybia butyracea]|uniref:Peptidase S8/S53 domain-containing protein n=1 Tax=Rhodocollybia butyracea TaxID=206335 RepID=A0A9P5Q3N8_9AGAR|nr:peptidase S8/S53 domain-containing protein [Rhodocollybia butyracea]